jgi:D-alanyl-D-alanine carboxypeptidase
VTDVDEAVRSFAREHSFSGVVAVADAGRRRDWAFGLADRELGTPNTADTRFQIGSISKWITVVALLTLVDDGLLELETPIGAYLAALPADAGRRVTLVHLLSNTSGIEDRLPIELINRPDVAASELSAVDAVREYVRGPLRFAPGSDFDYSHTNWLLVQAIVEAVTGTSLEDVLRERLFEPLELRATGVTHGSFAGVPGGAIAYESAHDDAARKLHVTPGFLVATGKIFSDCRDLVRLSHAVYHDEMLSPRALAALTTVRHVPEDYALGGRVLEATLRRKRRTLALQLGSSGGFKAMVAHVVEDDVTVVALNNANLSQDALTELAGRVLRTLN